MGKILGGGQNFASPSENLPKKESFSKMRIF
jgi:hypothetical protein